MKKFFYETGFIMEGTDSGDKIIADFFAGVAFGIPNKASKEQERIIELLNIGKEKS